eukprot:1307283-Amphidinium_carterae.1
MDKLNSFPRASNDSDEDGSYEPAVLQWNHGAIGVSLLRLIVSMLPAGWKRAWRIADEEDTARTPNPASTQHRLPITLDVCYNINHLKRLSEILSNYSVTNSYSQS